MSTSQPTRYFLEMHSQHGLDWKPHKLQFDDPAQFYNLQRFIKEAENLVRDDSRGSAPREIRVVDGDGNVYAHLVKAPYGFAVNIKSEPVRDWVEQLRTWLQIDKEAFSAGLRDWLSSEDSP